MDLTRVTTLAVKPIKSLFEGGQPYDLVSIADLSLELYPVKAGADDYLQKLITRASRAAQKYCNRTFVPATWMDQVWPASGYFPWQLPPATTRFQLTQYPLQDSVTPCLAGTAPPGMPTLALASVAGLAAARYYVRLTYVTPQGETAASLEANLNCPAGQGFVVPAPGVDSQGLAVGYNIYAATSSFGEALQNAEPISINSGWTLPGAGLVSGASPPPYVTIVENATLAARPLTEGIDFIVDSRNGLVDRLWHVNGQPKPWALPATAIYAAGYAEIPEDIQEAVILLAKMRWFARTRDPMIRSQNVEGVMSTDYWLGTGLGGQGDLPVDVTEKLDRYRTPVVA